MSARPAGFGGGAKATGEKESHPLRQAKNRTKKTGLKD